MIKKLGAVLGGVGLVLSVSACGGEEPAEEVSREDVAMAAFEDFMLSEGLISSPELLPDAVAVAESLCAGYDRGLTFVDVIKLATDAGFSGYEAGQINGAATAAFCPEYATG